MDFYLMENLTQTPRSSRQVVLFFLKQWRRMMRISVERAAGFLPCVRQPSPEATSHTEQCWHIMNKLFNSHSFDFLQPCECVRTHLFLHPRFICRTLAPLDCFSIDVLPITFSVFSGFSTLLERWNSSADSSVEAQLLLFSFLNIDSFWSGYNYNILSPLPVKSHIWSFPLHNSNSAAGLFPMLGLCHWTLDTATMMMDLRTFKNNTLTFNGSSPLYTLAQSVELGK